MEIQGETRKVYKKYRIHPIFIRSLVFYQAQVSILKHLRQTANQPSAAAIFHLQLPSYFHSVSNGLRPDMQLPVYRSLDQTQMYPVFVLQAAMKLFTLGRPS